MQVRNHKKVLSLFLFLLAGLLIFFIGGVAKLLIVSALLAYILDPLVMRLESRGMSRTGATTLLMLVLIVGLIVLLTVMVPLLLEQVKSLQTGFGGDKTAQAIERLQLMLRSKLGFLGMANIDLHEKVQTAKADLMKAIGEFIVQDFINIIVHLVTVPFIIFFLLKDGIEMKKQFIRLVPNRYFEFSMDLIYKMDQQLGNYLRGQFVDALTFGTLATIALWLLDVKYFLFIGVFAGMANLIPYVGPIAGMIPAIAVSILDSGDAMRAVYVVLAFAGLKLIDDVVIQPFVVAKSVDLHPLLVLLAILIGGHLFGILGMLIAVPCAGFFKVVLFESVQTLKKYRFTG
jgi:predicted PurR-regulated permease PerM